MTGDMAVFHSKVVSIPNTLYFPVKEVKPVKAESHKLHLLTNELSAQSQPGGSGSIQSSYWSHMSIRPNFFSAVYSVLKVNVSNFLQVKRPTS